MKSIGLHIIPVMFRVLYVDIPCWQFTWQLWGQLEICVVLMIVISTSVNN